MAWLDRYLKGDTSVDTGPRFEWLAEDGAWRSAADYPLKSAGELTASGEATLPITPVSTSGALILGHSRSRSPAPPRSCRSRARRPPPTCSACPS